jgi:hypothetical protein
MEYLAAFGPKWRGAPIGTGGAASPARAVERSRCAVEF